MADELDLSEPLADRAHDGIRRAVLQAIADLQDAAVGVEDSYFLTDLLFQLVDQALTAADELTTRVEQLERWRADTAAATGDRLDVIPVSAETAAQTGSTLGISLTTGWTWVRIATNGEEIARGQTYTREADAWRGAHRANPDL